jgi:hypothetical protein
MRCAKRILTIVLSCAVSVISYGQVRKSPRSSTFRVPHVSKSKARIMCPIFENSQYPYQGVGLKLGDPFALTYKYYPNKHWSFAADAGKAASGLYNKYYRNAYNTYLPDTLSQEQRINYLAHKATKDWFLEAKFLYQWDAEKISRGLQFYAGVGWQWRITTLRYDYNISDDSNISGNDGKFGKFTENRFTYGPVLLTGFEYSYFSLPLSAFIEVEWFTDTLLDPGYQRFQGGVGLRYVF